MAVAGPGAGVIIDQSSTIIRSDVVAYESVLVQVGMFSMWHRVATADNGGVTLGEIAAALDQAVEVLVKAAMGNFAEYRGTMSRVIWPGAPSAPAYSNTYFGAGTAAGGPLPLQTSGLIALYTKKAGRAYRGRRYVPFPASGDNGVNGVPSAGYQAGLDLIGTEITRARTVTGVLLGTVQLVPILWHRKTSTFDDLAGHKTRTGWATQRRRSYFGRQNVPPF